jgi:hypothetical protein
MYWTQSMETSSSSPRLNSQKLGNPYHGTYGSGRMFLDSFSPMGPAVFITCHSIFEKGNTGYNRTNMTTYLECSKSLDGRILRFTVSILN